MASQSTSESTKKNEESVWSDGLIVVLLHHALHPNVTPLTDYYKQQLLIESEKTLKACGSE
jgi:hypothetical protein